LAARSWGSLTLTPGYIRSPASRAHARNAGSTSTGFATAHPRLHSIAPFGGSHAECWFDLNGVRCRSSQATFGRPLRGLTGGFDLNGVRPHLNSNACLCGLACGMLVRSQRGPPAPKFERPRTRARAQNGNSSRQRMPTSKHTGEPSIARFLPRCPRKGEEPRSSPIPGTNTHNPTNKPCSKLVVALCPSATPNNTTDIIAAKPKMASINRNGPTNVRKNPARRKMIPGTITAMFPSIIGRPNPTAAISSFFIIPPPQR